MQHNKDYPGLFCLIVPTRNRPKDIRALLDNLSEQSIQPLQIIIIDSSDTAQHELPAEYPDLSVEYHVFEGVPSAAAQRNAGLEFVASDVELVGFVDDDIQFRSDAMERILGFWKEAGEGVCGAAFNLKEEKQKKNGGLKYSIVSRWLGLYYPTAGAVAPSGWHTRLGQVKENTQVDWLISGAVLWRKKVLNNHRFDPFFQGYSYLEDLDFSYGVSRECNLVVVAEAVFEHHHHHENLDAQWYQRFGRMEARNRLYFVRKHGLSVWRCYLGLSIRMIQTLLEAVFARKPVLLSRIKGNLAGLWESMWKAE
jgi:glycosyltransferase involved in cell wall biosynthesis